MRRADKVHQTLDAMRKRISQPQARCRDGEASVVGGETQVTRKRHRATAAEAEAVDHRDHRFRQRRDHLERGMRLSLVRGRHCCVCPCRRELGDVCAARRLRRLPRVRSPRAPRRCAPSTGNCSARPRQTARFRAFRDAGRLISTHASGASMEIRNSDGCRRPSTPPPVSSILAQWRRPTRANESDNWPPAHGRGWAWANRRGRPSLSLRRLPPYIAGSSVVFLPFLCFLPCLWCFFGVLAGLRLGLAQDRLRQAHGCNSQGTRVQPTQA